MIKIQGFLEGLLHDLLVPGMGLGTVGASAISSLVLPSISFMSSSNRFSLSRRAHPRGDIPPTASSHRLTLIAAENMVHPGKHAMGSNARHHVLAFERIGKHNL